ncbi:MAG: YlaN family protein [Ligilactobacillus acidipiscis]|jgi:uncharacterized protein YlaN (UPF0358 family)|nr:YlaN family protein [Ligilactobacillus acidipiscis]MCI1953828.1 YlaN family protein [Ligilactobacillus acidipiscis]
MKQAVSKKDALAILQESADSIRQLISNQKYALCLTDCPAFDDVADTRIYGFSCQVQFAVSCGLLTNDKGKQMVTTLENDLEMIKQEAVDRAAQ